MRSVQAGALAIAVLLFAVLAACGDDDSEDVSDGTPTLTPGTPIPLETFVPFEGQLGDFLITPGEADNEIVCEEATISQMASELAEAFPEREIIESTCSAAASLETGALLTRFAYTDELRVPFAATRDRLELVTVAGRPGIIARPPVEQLPSRAIVLEREANGGPGVFIDLSLSPDEGGIEDGLDFVEQFLER